MIFTLGLVPMKGNCQVNFRGGLQLFLGLFSKDDIHIWTGAHDLKMSVKFQGALQLFSGLFSHDDIHCWTGAHGLKVSGQFQGGFAAVLRSLFQKMIFILGLVPMI